MTDRSVKIHFPENLILRCKKFKRGNQTLTQFINKIVENYIETIEKKHTNTIGSYVKKDKETYYGNPKTRQK